MLFQLNQCESKNLPKCCENEQILIRNGTLFSCTNNTFTTSYFTTGNKERCFSGGFCLEQTNTSISERKIIKVSCDDFSKYEDFYLKPTLIKCCPEDRTYDPFEHKCVRREKNLIWNFKSFDYDYEFVKIGLSDCKGLITDYFLKNLSDVTNHSDGSISFEGLDRVNFGQYCLDRSDDDGYVVRVCKKDTKDCKKGPDDFNGIKCIRKCCPDGHSYVGRPECVPIFEHGINVKHKKIRSNQGKYLFELDFFYETGFSYLEISSKE